MVYPLSGNPLLQHFLSIELNALTGKFFNCQLHRLWSGNKPPCYNPADFIAVTHLDGFDFGCFRQFQGMPDARKVDAFGDQSRKPSALCGKLPAFGNHPFYKLFLTALTPKFVGDAPKIQDRFAYSFPL